MRARSLISEATADEAIEHLTDDGWAPMTWGRGSSSIFHLRRGGITLSIDTIYNCVTAVPGWCPDGSVSVISSFESAEDGIRMALSVLDMLVALREMTGGRFDADGRVILVVVRLPDPGQVARFRIVRNGGWDEMFRTPGASPAYELYMTVEARKTDFGRGFHFEGPDGLADALADCMAWWERENRLIAEARDPGRIRDDQVAIETMEDDGWKRVGRSITDRLPREGDLCFVRGNQFVELKPDPSDWIEIICAGAFDDRGHRVDCAGIRRWSERNLIDLRTALGAAVAASDAALRLVGLGMRADPRDRNWAVVGGFRGGRRLTLLECFLVWSNDAELNIRASIGANIRDEITMAASDPRTWDALAEAVRLVRDGAGPEEIHDAMRRILT